MLAVSGELTHSPHLAGSKVLVGIFGSTDVSSDGKIHVVVRPASKMWMFISSNNTIKTYGNPKGKILRGTLEGIGDSEEPVELYRFGAETTLFVVAVSKLDGYFFASAFPAC
ncbi:hypothetical protein EVAR_87126_1 [Eumeta japonica]|uniref:Uncharacterized protein n=1 Tax=Eumeta variegata TaxID=151549 RepID=A0A4C1VXM6_EUMVA|nr:hypothetical protein EVAR_87126_1 [Eumeta japonica]